MKSPKKPSPPTEPAPVTPVPLRQAPQAHQAPSTKHQAQGQAVIIIDPGHGMSNRVPGRYDPGAVIEDRWREATVVLHWAQDLHYCITQEGHTAHMLRTGDQDPLPLRERVSRARALGGTLLISLHTNPLIGTANGTETFYRGAANKALAQDVNACVVRHLGLNNRGAKTEAQLGKTLAVLAFPRAILLELGFLGWPADRVAMLDPQLRLKTCRALAPLLIRHATTPA